MHVFITTIGTAGDVYPLLGLGRALAAREHRVTFAVNNHFATEVAAAGLAFLSIGTEPDWRAVFEDPRWYDPKHGLGFFFRTALIPATEKVYRAIADHPDRDRMVVAAAVHVFGAHLAHLRHAIPMASICLQPSTQRWVLPSDVLRATPRESDLAVRLQAAMRLMEARWLDDVPTPPPAAARIHLGLFPEWFVEPPADWPQSSVLSAFPLYDGAAEAGLPPGAEAFLDQKRPVVLVNPGSNVHWAGDFCAAVLGACEQLGFGAAVLTRYAEQVSTGDPERFRRFDFLPMGLALSYAAAMVHHAGISTVGRCLAAGVPQLVSPLGYDHPYNADTLETLGVGTTIAKTDLTVPAVAEALDRLVNDPSYRTRARAFADRMEGSDSLAPACAAIEGLAERVPGGAM